MTMDAALERVEEEILQLTAAQRAELADFLAERLELPESEDIQRLWVTEATRRLSDIRSGNVKAIPGDEVLAEARSFAKRR